jgi:hypothetical protein
MLYLSWLQCCGSGSRMLLSRIRPIFVQRLLKKFVNSLYTKMVRIQDPVLLYPPDPGSGSGMEKRSDPDLGSGIKHPVSATLPG